MFLESVGLGIEKIELSKLQEQKNVRRLDHICSIAGVGQQLDFIFNAWVIKDSVIRDDDYAVICALVVEWRTE